MSWLRSLFLFFVVAFPLAVRAGDGRDLGPAVQVEMANEARVALVIGNGTYSSGALKNPVRDARAVATALRAQGFTVTLVENAGKPRMEEAIIDFGRALRAGGVGLFYFAGHGVEQGGANYLVPVDADLSDDAYIRSRTVEVGYVTAEMEASRNRLNILILDACRNNPFAAHTRSTSRALATVAGPTGTYIAYSASAGEVAADGTGSNSPFAAALVAHLPEPGADLDALFNAVRTEVYTQTSRRQTPESRNKVVGPSFYFTLPVATAPAPTPAPPSQAGTAEDEAPGTGGRYLSEKGLLKLACDGDYTNEQKEAMASMLLGHRVVVAAKPTTIFDDYTSATPSAEIGGVYRLNPRSKDAWQTVQKGVVQVFDCQVAGYCEDNTLLPENLDLKDCVLVPPR